MFGSANRCVWKQCTPEMAICRMMIDHGIQGILFSVKMKAFAKGLTTANVKEQDWQRLLSSAPVALYAQQLLE